MCFPDNRAAGFIQMTESAGEARFGHGPKSGPARGVGIDPNRSN
jgi:hypothetical protein